ncbi:QRFP-like peptide receptor [Crassostrea virginica]
MASELNLSESERLELWNKSRFEAFLPSTVYLVLCIVVGVAGNGVVIYIYRCRLQGKHDGRYFIPHLAVADLSAVIASGELHIMNNLYPVTYRFEKLCKWNFVFGFVATVFSTCILLLITVQRYLKVCRPFGGQMVLFWRRFSLLLSLLMTVILGVPSYFTFGLEKVSNLELNVTGSACRRLTTTTQTLSLIHATVCTMLVVTEGALLIVLYVNISKVIFQQKDQNLGKPDTKKTNISKMFMVITIIYLVSFLPRMITFLLEGTKAGLWETISVEAYGVVRMVELLYIVNHVANPFVYAFMDVKFVKEFKQVFSCKNQIATRPRCEDLGTEFSPVI